MFYCINPWPNLIYLSCQDLDDKVIHHLSEENRRLKEELELVREGHEIGVAEGKQTRGDVIVMLQARGFALVVMLQACGYAVAVVVMLQQEAMRLLLCCKGNIRGVVFVVMLQNIEHVAKVFLLLQERGYSVVML